MNTSESGPCADDGQARLEERGLGVRVDRVAPCVVTLRNVNDCIGEPVQPDVVEYVGEIAEGIVFGAVRRREIQCGVHIQDVGAYRFASIQVDVYGAKSIGIDGDGGVGCGKSGDICQCVLRCDAVNGYSLVVG